MNDNLGFEQINSMKEVLRLYGILNEMDKNSANGHSYAEYLLSPEAFASYKEHAGDVKNNKTFLFGLDPDPQNWTDDDIDSVVARVKRGERIEL